MTIKMPKQDYKIIKTNLRQHVEIPQEWNLKKLSEIGDVVSGGTPDSTKKEYWNGETWWAVPSDIVKLSGNFIEKTERTITELGLKEKLCKTTSTKFYSCNFQSHHRRMCNKPSSNGYKSRISKYSL